MCEADAVAEKEVSEDIFSARMKCEQCEYNTDTYIPKESTVTEKLQLYGFHRKDKHRQAMWESNTEESRRKVKFPQPGTSVGSMGHIPHTVGVIQEADEGLAGQLISCGSKELQTSLQRITGRTLYQKTEADLLDEMKKLMVRYQNPAVYVEELLSI